MEIEDKNSDSGIDRPQKNVPALETSTHKYIHADIKEELHTNLTPEEIREHNKVKEVSQNIKFGYNLLLSLITIIVIFVSNYFVNEYVLWIAKMLPLTEQHILILESVLRGFTILLAAVLAISTLSGAVFAVYKKQKSYKATIAKNVQEKEAKILEDISESTDRILGKGKA